MLVSGDVMKIRAKDIINRKIARPLPEGMESPAPGDEMAGPGGDPSMGEEMPAEASPEREQPQQEDVPTMVRRISQDYLGDEKIGEIQEAIMNLIGFVTPEISKDVAKDFGKFMEAAAILKANLNALLVMQTPQRGLKQLQLYPEETPAGLRSDILT